MPRTHLGLKWVIFLARSPLIRPHWLGEPCGDWAGKRWRVCRFAMSIVLVKYGSILANSGYFWPHFFPPFFTLTFLPYHLMLANYKTLWNDHSWIPFSKSFHLICNILGCKRKSRPEKRKKHFHAAESYMIYVEMKKNHVLFDNFFVCGPISKL